MTEPDRRLSLELTAAATPICGSLRDERGHVWTFSSWLGLLAALTAAIPGAAIPGSDTREAGDRRGGPGVGGAGFDAGVLDASAEAGREQRA